MSLRFGIRLKCSTSLPERIGDLLRRVPELFLFMECPSFQFVIIPQD